MKLEIKHISCYLPYRVQVEIERLKYPRGKEIVELNLKNIDQFDNKKMWKLKPILRPMSDLKSFKLPNPLEPANMSPAVIFSDNTVEMCYYKEYEFLFQNHFDIFGLIEHGFAISIHDLEK